MGLVVWGFRCLGLAMWGIAAASTALAAGAAPALIALGVLALGLAAVGLALKLVSSADLESLATMMESVAKVSNPFGGWDTGLKNFANTAEDSVDSIGKLAGALAWASLFADTEGMGAMVQVVQAVSKIDKGNVAGLEAASAMLHQIKVTANTAQVDSLNALAQTVGKLQKAKMAPIQLEVSLNGKVFEGAVNKVVENRG